MSTVSRKMNSPQWKNFQPPVVQDPAILSYQRAPNLLNSLISSSPPKVTTININANQIRETGIVEKLLHSYGFIQCCDRDARLFFHFSEYGGDMDTVSIGDAVEFQMSCDKRTGRPIACQVIKVDANSVSTEILSEERFIGTVVQEAKPGKVKNGMVGGTTDGLGRVTYEHNGECFFLPYGLDDIVNSGNTQVKPGDQVTFFIARDKRNGNLHARKVEPAQTSATNQKYQGVVCSMKESFGFIERADIVKEIFFHYSEFKGNITQLLLGDDVEFEIQTRNGKEVAVTITSMPQGTVIFEDVSVEKKKGKISKTLKSNRRQSDPLGGRVMYESAKGPTEIPFGDKDQAGEYTLQQGDLVEFHIATDRRDKLQRATQIKLLLDTFEKSTERRELGVIASLKEGFGFIQCAERDARMFFHYSELLESANQASVGGEVEFTVTQDPTTPSRQVAIRIHYMPVGSISAYTIRPEKYVGTIDREPADHKSPTKNKDNELGNIVFDYEGAIKNIQYSAKDIAEPAHFPKYADKVEFSIGEQKRTSTWFAVNIKVIFRNTVTKCQGYIATLKDNYGFIENADHDKEVFFHFSSVEGDANELDLGDEVEYSLTRKSTKTSAENIVRLSKGTVAAEEILREKGVVLGKIIRPMRIVNPDQEEYSGLVQVGTEDDLEAQTYPYGITSLADKRDFLQKGDIVKFQVAVVKSTKKERAVNIAAIRKYIRARVDSIKDKYGFINYEVEEGKKLFFHMTEVHDGVQIQSSDEVEFVVVQNQRNGKYSACSVRKISDIQRPERLMSRLKSVVDDNVGPKLIVLRQPKGPDGTKGFIQPRTPWKPPA
ncbi:hypothetical protein ACJMK2_028687 [Sinanodonta woodiana]|uniref:Cold shock domain-containing protein E1 n=1 Tax=Sinanodonta woodiana TaxID=1069815 RepID=A0ABD3X7W0_SINWO